MDARNFTFHKLQHRETNEVLYERWSVYSTKGDLPNYTVTEITETEYNQALGMGATDPTPMSAEDVDRKLEAAAREQKQAGWLNGVAIMYEDGTIYSNGYQKEGWAFRWANRFIGVGMGICGLIVGDTHTYARFNRDEGWVGF